MHAIPVLEGSRIVLHNEITKYAISIHDAIELYKKSLLSHTDVIEVYKTFINISLDIISNIKKQDKNKTAFVDIRVKIEDRSNRNYSFSAEARVKEYTIRFDNFEARYKNFIEKQIKERPEFTNLEFEVFFVILVYVRQKRTRWASMFRFFSNLRIVEMF